MKESYLGDVLKCVQHGGDVENELKNFFTTHIPLSVEIVKLKMGKDNEEVFVKLKKNMNKLINECFFVIYNIINSILRDSMRIENVREEERYNLIYVWFDPICEMISKRKETTTCFETPTNGDTEEEKEKEEQCVVASYNSLDFLLDEEEGEGIITTQMKRLHPSGGVYLSEWIISGINKAFNMLNGENDSISNSRSNTFVALENWAFILDLMKFIYADANILSKYICGGVLNRADGDAHPSLTYSKNNNKYIKEITKRENNIDTELEKYHEDIYNIFKAYFAFPFILFKCIVNVGMKKGDDEKRKLYIYNHIIPKELNDEGFHKHIVKTCVSHWLHANEYGVNYERMALLTKRIIGCHLVNPFCHTLLSVLLRVSEVEETHDIPKKYDKKYEKKNTHILIRLNYILENLFYYIHLHCHGEHAGERLLTSIIRSMCPFVKIVQNENKLSLCLFNRNVEDILSVIINITFLYKWNFFILENFFNVFSRNCLPICFALTIIGLVDNFVASNFVPSNFVASNFVASNFVPSNFVSSNFVASNFVASNFVAPNFSPFKALFTNFMVKKKIIHSNQMISERRSYRRIVNESGGREKNGSPNNPTAWDTSDEYSKVGIMAFDFLEEMFFFVLGQFYSYSEEKGAYTFIPIILSKLLYTFSLRMKYINEKIIKNLHKSDVLSEVELHIYKMNSIHRMKIFENVTMLVHEFFKRKDELSLVSGQILADHFMIYVDRQMFRGEQKEVQTIIERNEETNDETHLFPNLQQPAEYFPEEIRCFKVIKQSEFMYLNDFLPMNDTKWGSKSRKVMHTNSMIVMGTVAQSNGFLGMGDLEKVEENCTKCDERPHSGKGQMGGQASEKMGDKSSEKMGDESSEKMGGQASEKMGDKSSEKMGDESSEKMGGQASEKMGDETSEKMGDETSEKMGDETSEKIVKNRLMSILQKWPIEEDKKKKENDMLMENADLVIDNDLYNLDEKEFLVELDLENEFYLNVVRNKNMYTDPAEDLFECLNRMKSKANYIERNIGEMNFDPLILNERKETYDEENFRICQAVVTLPKLIKKDDVLTYICVELYETLLSLKNYSCILSKEDDLFATIKLFDMILLTINSPVEITKFVFKNIYLNMHSNIQKMLMLLCLQFSVLFLSNHITLREIFQYVKNLTEQMNLSCRMMKRGKSSGNFSNCSKLHHKVERNEDHITYNKNNLSEISENFYSLFENLPKRKSSPFNDHIADGRIPLNICDNSKNKRESNDTHLENGPTCYSMHNYNDRVKGEGSNVCCPSTKMNSYNLMLNKFEKKNERNDICDFREKCRNTMSVRNNKFSKSILKHNEKKAKLMSNLCILFFNKAYIKLLSLNIKKEVRNMDYDEYKLRKYYSNDPSLVLLLISTYIIFFKCSCNSILCINDILTDGFTLTNIFIRNKNFLVRRVSFKLLFHMINHILKKKMFHILEYENYMNVISYTLENMLMEQDVLSLNFMKYILEVHESIKGEQFR
ncbi:hypothetical protein, conserved [Plasmodium gonderi]|uniref:Telomere length regulation protein conserved domain-containing protein n=1 Tax=Plasmodium gonderi TaxID=77519 RepID=A0A1Y1JCB4_PLAGO|nr:hypothetical protein, conserved [Plasmodium gonderi]GAW80136.1 hypothetical protein, conserved [Plasmodium gonderi]